MFSTNVESDLLGKRNGFRQIISKLAVKTVQENKWPTMLLTVSKEQEALLKKKNKQGDMMLSLVCEAEDKKGMYPPIVAIYRYLIKNYLCYMEVPYSCYVEVPHEKFHRDTNQKVPCFQKRLITANLDIIAEWLGMTTEEVFKKYGKHFESLEDPLGDEEFRIPFLELRETKDKEHKITKPRKTLDLTTPKLAVYPLFMLKASMDTLYKELEDGICKIVYLNDNGCERTLYTTVNKAIQKDIYGSTSKWFEDSLVNTYKNNFLTNDALFRGYVRLPEIGGSKYDNSTRSLNYTRVLHIERDAKPDLACIDIDL